MSDEDKTYGLEDPESITPPLTYPALMVLFESLYGGRTKSIDYYIEWPDITDAVKELKHGSPILKKMRDIKYP